MIRSLFKLLLKLFAFILTPKAKPAAEVIPQSGKNPVDAQKFARFEVCLARLLGEEGGLADRPLKDDPGGRTNHGVTHDIYDRWRKANGLPVRDVAEITRGEVRDIYHDWYWAEARCGDLPKGVDYAVFDFCVMTSMAKVIYTLQAVVGAQEDGVMGPKTIAAVRAKNPATTVGALHDARLAYYKTRRNWEANKNGWQKRLKKVKAQSLTDIKEV